jgi:hypothetical protein
MSSPTLVNGKHGIKDVGVENDSHPAVAHMIDSLIYRSIQLLAGNVRDPFSAPAWEHFELS